MRRLSLILPLVVLASAAFAQAPAKNPLVSVTGANMDVMTVLSHLASQSGQTIMAAPGVSAKVDIALADLPLEDALDAVTSAAHLKWRKVLASPGTTRAELQTMVADADRVSRTSIVSAASGSHPASAVLSGSTASKLWGMADELGLREIYWIYSPAARAPVSNSAPAQPTPAASESATASTDETSGAASESAAETPAQAYDKLTNMLSQLTPEEAMGVLQQAQQDLAATYAPPPEPMLPQVYSTGGPAVVRPGNAAMWGPPRVRMTQPSSPVIVRPSYPPPFYWGY